MDNHATQPAQYASRKFVWDANPPVKIFPRLLKKRGKIIQIMEAGYSQGVIPGISICPPSGISSCISDEGAGTAGNVEKLIPFGAAPLGMVAMTVFSSMSITDTVFS